MKKYKITRVALNKQDFNSIREEKFSLENSKSFGVFNGCDDDFKTNYSNDIYVLYIKEKKLYVPIGYIQINVNSWGRIFTISEVYILKKYRDKNWGSILIIYGIHLIFNIFSGNKLECACFSSNESVDKIYSKVLKKEGCRRETIIINYKKFDTNIYGLLKDEYEESKVLKKLEKKYKFNFKEDE